jgi:hypothetical protein
MQFVNSLFNIADIYRNARKSNGRSLLLTRADVDGLLTEFGLAPYIASYNG